MKAFLFAVLLFLVRGSVSQDTPQDAETESLNREDEERIRDILRLRYTLSPYNLLFPLNPCKFGHVTIKHSPMFPQTRQGV